MTVHIRDLVVTLVLAPVLALSALATPRRLLAPRVAPVGVQVFAEGQTLGVRVAWERDGAPADQQRRPSRRDRRMIAWMSAIGMVAGIAYFSADCRREARCAQPANAIVGAIVGSLGGAVVGGVAIAILGREDPEDEGPLEQPTIGGGLAARETGEALRSSLGLGAPGGGLTGAVVGTAFPRWRRRFP